MVDLEAVQTFGEALKKNLQCPICLSLLKNPTSGDCLHKFCKVCIDQQIVIRKKPKCPICNKPISRRSLRETSELTSVLRGVESILTTINSEGAVDSGSEDPIIPFSQFELTTCKSPEKVPEDVLKKALLTTPLSVNCASNHPPSSTITPAVRSKPGYVANTPASSTITPAVRSKPGYVANTPASSTITPAVRSKPGYVANTPASSTITPAVRSKPGYVANTPASSTITPAVRSKPGYVANTPASSTITPAVRSKPGFVANTPASSTITPAVRSKPGYVANTPASSTITPAVRSKPGYVANTPARKWNVAESSSSSRKRKKTASAETESHKGALEKNRLLLETIEKGNLGEKSKLKKCSRKAMDITKMESEGDVLSKEAATTNLLTNNTEKNKENLVKISLQAPSPLNKKSLLNSEESVAAKSRALQRLMKNVRNVEESGRISNTSLNSTSYQSPKPTSSVGKKVSPFVVKTINKTTPSPDITIINKPVLSSKPDKAAESEEEDSLEIGVKKNKNKNTEIKILSSEEEEEASPTTSSHSSESRRRSLRRKVVKPPIIDDEDSIAFQIPHRDESEPNTIDVLEISFGLRGPSEVFKDSISISNAKTKSKPSEKIDVIKIGQHARHNAVKPTSEVTNNLDASGKSVEMIEPPSIPAEMNQDDDLPSCGFESELSMTFTNEQFKVAEEVKKAAKELPKPDLSNVQPQNEAKSLRKSALSRRKADDLKVLETPNLQSLPHSEPLPAPVTPLFCDAIKSSNTVLETPMIPKREAMVLETPVVSMKPHETKKRSIEYDTKDNDKTQNSAEKRARHNIGRDHDRKYPLTENKGDVNKGIQHEDKRGKSKMKDFISKVSTTPTSKRNDHCTPVARKNAVVEKVYTNPNKDKTSPKLTIDKDGNTTNYTIENISAASKLTIIQEGPGIMSPKLMKHIYEDVLHSDPNSCEDLINSLTADHHNSLNSAPPPDQTIVTKSASMESRSIEVDHQALIFGEDSVEITATDKPAHQIQTNSDNAPDSLEGYTYNNPQFNEKEFKKTFGILNESYSLATDNNVMVFEENTNVSDEVKLSQLSQQRERMIKDSQPKIVRESPQTSQSSQAHDPLNEAHVFDTVPYKDMTTLEDGGTAVGESVGDLESETKLHRPLSSSTQQTKDTSSPRTPNRTLISSSGQSYTSQEFAVMRQQLRENQAELLRLQEIEQAGAAVADTLQPELLIKPVLPESSGDKINETIVEQESLTQGELFEDLVSASNDITICEMEEPASISDKTVIYRYEDRKSNCKSRENVEERSNKPSLGEINTAELIALNEAAIEGAKVPLPREMSLGIIQESEMMTSADIISNTDSVPTQIEGVSAAGEGDGDKLNVSSQHTLENKEVKLTNPKQSNTKKTVISGIVKEVPSLKDNISEVERRSEEKESGETAVKKFYIPNIPRPDIGNSDSLDSNYVPPSQERSPVIVSRRPSLTVTPVKIVNILLSGMLGKSGSKEAFQLRKSIRGSCHVKFRVLTQYTDAVTHLIFPHNDSMTCPRTAKYFRGIAGGKWILSNQWLIQSYKSQELLHEAPYEMQGDTESGRTCAPRSARIARVLKHPPLFANTSVYYVGDIRILPRDHFSSLLEAVGVTIVHSPDSGSSISQLTYKTQTKVSPLIDSDVTDINTVKEVSGLAPITAQWIVECIAAYKVLPPEDLI